MLVSILSTLLAGCSAEPADSAADTATGDSGVDSADSGGDSGGDSGDTGGETGEDSGDTGEDTGSGPPCTKLRPTVTVAEAIPTVFTVEWATEEPTTGHIEWGYDASYGYSTVDDGTRSAQHRIVVAGPAERTTVHWRAVSTADGVECATDDQTIEIGSTGKSLSPMTLEGAFEGFSPGFRVMAVAGSRPFIGVVDDAARLVWSLAVPEGYAPLMGQMDVNATHLLFLLEQDETRLGMFLRVSLDQTEVETYPLPYAHHAFVQHPDGTYTFVEADPREFEGLSIAGDALVRYDANLEGRDVVWSTWDDWEPNATAVAMTDSGYYPDWLDWTHGNGVSLRSDGSYLFSMHNVSKVSNITADGILRWTLPGDGAVEPEDFAFEGTLGEVFRNQHSPSEVPGGVLIFDNGYTADHTETSEAGEYAVDEENGTFHRVWSFGWTGNMYVNVEGDAQRLPNGNTLVTWGSNGSITEVTPEGEVVWEAANLGQTLGFMEHYPSIGGAVR